MSGNTESEGVVKYRLDFSETPLQQVDLARQLEPWRQRLRALGLIGGNDPARYGGLGFGNISHRKAPGSSEFIISGTQTGHLPDMHADAYALVTRCDPLTNTIVAEGETPPSSEAMTHAAIYAAAPLAQVVMHIHSPSIWHQAKSLGIPVTDPTVAYGTVAMANELTRLITSATCDRNVISMAGHEDGIISWGTTLAEAGEILLQLARSSRPSARPR